METKRRRAKEGGRREGQDRRRGLFPTNLSLTTMPEFVWETFGGRFG